MQIEIEYCAPCGYLSRAVSLTGKLLEARDEDIVRLVLVPGDNGIFDVVVDGNLVYSKEKTGRFPESDEILTALPARGAPRELDEGASCPLPSDHAARSG